MKNNYETLRQEAEKKRKTRQLVTNAKGREVEIRRHHLLSKKAEKLKLEFNELMKDEIEALERAGDKFFNPFRKNGIYHGVTQALFLLGANEYYIQHVVHDKTREVMEPNMVTRHGVIRSSWEWYRDNKIRNLKTGKCDKGRLHGTLRTLQRLGGRDPYGLKFKEMCCCIDVEKKSDGHWYYKLNTKFETPNDVKPIYISNIKFHLVSPKGETKVISGRGRKKVEAQ